MRTVALLSLSLTLSLLAAGCTWVKLEPQARAVRVARPGADLSACQRAGEISVSVRDRVGFYDRNELKVRDELETMARNEAQSLDADTLQAVAPPANGEQRFVGYRCDAGAGADAGAATAQPTRPATEAVPAAAAEPAVAQPLPSEPRPTRGFEPIDEDG